MEVWVVTGQKKRGVVKTRRRAVALNTDAMMEKTIVGRRSKVSGAAKR